MRTPALAWLCSIVLAALLSGCAGGLTVSQREVDFGKVLVGASSPAVALHWTNNTAQQYTIFLWNPADAPFASTHPNDQVVNPGASTGMASATFAPAAAGRASSKVRPRTGPTSSDSARLRGEGVLVLVEGIGIGVEDASGAAQSNEIDFGRKHINAPPPKAATFTVTNTTTAPVTLSATVIGGAPVFGVRNASITVPAVDASTSPPTPGSAAVTLTFAPTAVGEQWGAVVLVGAHHRIGVSMKGTGVATAAEEEGEGQ